MVNDMETSDSVIRDIEGILSAADDSVRQNGLAQLIVAPDPSTRVAEGACLAAERGLVQVTFVGDRNTISAELKSIGFPRDRFKIVTVSDEHKAILRAVNLGLKNKNSIFLPGGNSVPKFFQHLFSRDSSFLRRGDFLSLCGVMEHPVSGGLFLVSDVGLVPDPTVEQGISIIKNAVSLARVVGKETVRVALLAFEGEATPSSPTTMAERIIERYLNQKGDPTVIVDGPIRLEKAMSDKAIPRDPTSAMAQGPADIMIASNIHVGNSMYKAMMTLCKMKSAPIVIGGQVPIALPSSSEPADNILNSIALSVLVRHSRSSF
jgi:phosphate butyryltransferase